MPHRAKLIWPLFFVIWAPGCRPTSPPGFDSPEPMSRVDAALEVAASASTEPDEASIPDLIAMLDSDDPLARMVAIRTLERLTGQDLGYRHDDRELRRREATNRWMAWWAEASGYDAPTQSTPARVSGVSPARHGAP